MKHLTIALLVTSLMALVAYSMLSPSEPMPSTQMKADLESTALRYFLENAHPVTGLIRDNALNFSMTPESNRQCSMAATGFGLAVIANAATRGMVEREFARAYALKVLQFSRDHVARYKGWFLHFVDWGTGARYERSEYSTVDSALFMAGALYAAQVLGDAEISKIVHQLYADMDYFEMLTDGGKQPKKKTLSMAYLAEEKSFSERQWSMYAEQTILLVMGLGHPTHPLPADTWLAWARPSAILPSGEKMMGIDASLFIHQYSQLFVDFRGFRDGFANYYENSVVASRYMREIARSDTGYKTFREGFWGLSAGAAPGGGYEAWNPTQYRGVACIDCVIGSAMFMPEVVLEDAAHWRAGSYGAKIWGRYGFTDSLDLDRSWISPSVYGITKGPAFMALANMNAETSIWNVFMTIPEIRAGLERAGSLSGNSPDSRKPGSTK